MIHEIKLLPYVEVYFPKLDEVLASDRVVKRDVGELVLNGKCLGGRVNDGSIGHEPALLSRQRSRQAEVVGQLPCTPHSLPQPTEPGSRPSGRGLSS